MILPPPFLSSVCPWLLCYSQSGLPLFPPLKEIAAKYADEIIVLSENVQNYFMREYGRKTEFVPNGVNVPEILEADIIKDKWNVKKDSYILFLGRLVPEKGIKYLIEAYKQIKTFAKISLLLLQKYHYCFAKTSLFTK